MQHERQEIQIFVLEIILCGVFALVACAAILVLSRDPSSYGAASILKMLRLETAPSPRIIFEGGSGIAFNTDSETMEKGTGLHPVNLGLYAGFGMDFLTAQADSGSRHGDIIVVIPEYDILDGVPSVDGFLALEAAQEDPSLLRFASKNPHSLVAIARQFPGWFSTRIISLAGKTPLGAHFIDQNSTYHRVYRVQSFNVYGDMVGHLSETSTLDASSFASSSLPLSELNAGTVSSMRSFIAEEKTKGVTVLFSWPSLPRSIYEADKARIEEQDAALTQAVGSDRVLGAQGDFVFSDDDFFDSINHLDATGREIRTQRFIIMMKRWLASNSR